jgi:hypothetical protein
MITSVTRGTSGALKASPGSAVDGEAGAGLSLG